jgi:hypothetical protein
MRGRRPEADPRFTFHGSWERAEHGADDRRSFAAVERSMSDRLLGLVYSILNSVYVLAWIIHECRREAFEPEARRGFSQVRPM